MRGNLARRQYVHVGNFLLSVPTWPWVLWVFAIALCVCLHVAFAFWLPDQAAYSYHFGRHVLLTRMSRMRMIGPQPS